MTLPEFTITYAVCWWLVLFTMLPDVGSAGDGGIRPLLRRSVRRTSLVALMPALALLLIATVVQAAPAPVDPMLHASGRCKEVGYHAPADLAAVDGKGVGGRDVTPATIADANPLKDKDNFDIPLELPSARYVNPHGAPGDSGRNVDLSQSFIGIGKLNVTREGKATLDGHDLAPQSPPLPGCDEGDAASPAATDMLSTKHP